MSDRSPFRDLPCLVLGAGGFLGGNLCRRLVAEGAKVRAFTRPGSVLTGLAGVDWRTGDFLNAEAVQAAVQDMQVVFHLVGGSLPQSSNADPAADIYNSLLPTVRMLDACRAAGVSKVVFPSSGGTVYGCPRTVPIAETEPTDPIAAYGVSRLAIEKYLALYQRLHGLDYAILRIANPFGPGQLSRKGQGVIAALIKSALAGQTLEIWGDGEVVRDFVYVDDVIDSLMAVVPHAGPHRLFNVGHGVGRSINEVIADIEAMLGHGPLPRLYTPGRQADVPVNVLDIRLIQRELGWRPRTEWREALTRTADWVRKTGAVIE